MTNLLLYIDPSSGSMIFQAAIAGLMGFLMFFKQVKSQISNLFIKKSKTDKPQEKVES